MLPGAKEGEIMKTCPRVIALCGCARRVQQIAQGRREERDPGRGRAEGARSGAGRHDLAWAVAIESHDREVRHARDAGRNGEQMKAMMAQNQAHDFETCLTRGRCQASPKEDFFAGKNNECRYENFTMGGGKSTP